MIDLSSWLPGLPKDDEPEEEESAVSRTLRVLGQVPETLGDIGRSAGQSVVGAVQGATQAVQDAYAVPAEQRPPQYSGPSYAQPTREAVGLDPITPSERIEQITSHPLAQAGIQTASTMVGLTPPETALDVAAQAAPAPARLGIAASQLGSGLGAAALRTGAEERYGTEPLFSTPEIPTPLGTIPSLPVTPGGIGEVVGSVLGDPTTYVGGGALGRAADAPIEAATKAIGSAVGPATKAVGRAVARPFRGMTGALPSGVRGVTDDAARAALEAPGVQHLGSGVVPETGAPRPGWTPPPEIPDEEIQQFRRAAKLVEGGQPIPPDLPVITRPMPAREPGADPHQLHFFVTSAGEEVVLPPANRGTPGRGINAAYSDYIAAQGGHRGRPSGRYQDPSGAWHQYDSPQELLFMRHFDEQLARGADPQAEHGGLDAWWRGGESPYPEIESLPYVKTTMKPGEQAGVGGFEGDYVVRHKDGFVELVEGKDVKVMPKQEEWFQEPGKRPALAWNVLRKAAAAIPELAMQGRGFRMLTGRDSAAMVPTLGPSPLTGRGTPVKSFWGVPGVDWRDIPELDRGFPNAGPAVGNQIHDVVTETEREARALAADLQAAGVPRDAQLAQLTRLVRERLLPTADLAGRTTGEMRNVQGRVAAAVPEWNSAAGRVTQAQLEQHWPDGAAAVRSAEQQGAQIRSASVELVQGPADAAPSPRLFIEADGDPAAIQRLAVQLGQAHGDPGAATVWHYDWQGPTSVREVSFSGADPAIQASFDDVQAALRGDGDGVPQLVSRYNDDGSLATIHVLGQDAAGNPIDDRVVDGLLHRIRGVLAEFGVQADVGPSQRAVVRNFAAEGDYARALDLHEQSLGLRPLAPPPRGAPSAADRGGTAGRGPAAGGGPGAAGAAADRLADRGQSATGGPDRGLGSGVLPALRAPAYNFAQGGVLGAASESLQAQEEGRDVDPATMAQRALLGGGLAVAGGRYARPAARAAQRLGSGVVPGPAGLPIDPALVAAEAKAGPRRGAILNQKLDPQGSAVPLGVRTITALTDDLAATRWAEDLLTQASGRGRLAENAPERASTIKRINPDSVSEERIARELAPVVASARQEGLLDELVQYVQDTHEADVLQAFYRRSHDEATAAGATAAQADAAGTARMQRRSSANPDLSWEAVGARLEGQQQRLGARAKRVDELAQGLWDHNRDTLDHLRQSGRISQDQYDWLTDTYPHYVPTVPISHLDPGGGTAAVGKGGGVSAGRAGPGDVKAFEDVASPAERLNPIIASREATIARTRAAHRNDVFQAFARLYDEAQQAAPGTLQTSQGARKNRFLGEVEASGRVDGEPVTIRVPKPVADMIDTTAAQGGAGAGPMALWRKAMSAVTTSTTGRRAAFLPVNLARDFSDSLLRAGSEFGVTAIPEYLGHWMQEAGNAAVDLATGLFRGKMRPTGRSAEYLARGGGMGSAEGGWKAAEQWYDDVQRTGGLVVTDPKVLGAIMRDLATFKPVMAANERTELISRTAMMRMAERRGASPTEAMIAGRNASVDFQRAGQITRMFNGAIPFLNATVQSGAQLVRTLREHPRSAAATFATVVGVPVAAAEAYNRSDPNRAAAYNDVPQYVKDQGIVLMLPWSSSDTRGERPNYLWLPLGMGAPVAVAVREAMRTVPGLESTAGRADVPSDASEASRWETVLSQVLSTFSPIKGDSAAAIASSMVPPGAKQAVELGLNRSLYTGAPIASDTADERASSFGHAVAGAAGSLGRAVGSDLLQEVHPSHVDYLARQFPAYGDVATGLSDMIAPSAAKQAEQRPIANAPIVGGAAARIVRDVGGANLERAQSDMLSPTVRDALAEAGMRPSDVQPVQGSVSVQGQQMPLMRDEQVDYQERTTSYADREIDAAQRSADWRAEGADRESLVRAALTKARQKAADEVVRAIPPAERRQRIREAAERKAS